MKRKEYLDKIAEYLARFNAEVDIHNKNNEYDINIHSEDVLIPLLNKIFGLNLVNANRISKNFPAIDLIDTENRVAFQVSSTRTGVKVENTIEKFISHNLQEQIDILYLYFLDSTKSKIKIKESWQKELNFNEENILSNDKIYSAIKELPLTVIQEVYELLRSEFSDLKIEMRKVKRTSELEYKTEVVFSNLLELEFPKEIFVAKILMTDEQMMQELGWKRKRRGQMSRRELLMIYVRKKILYEEIEMDWVDFQDSILSFKHFSASRILSHIVDMGTISKEAISDLSFKMSNSVKYLLRVSLIERFKRIDIEWLDNEKIARFKTGLVPNEKQITWKLDSKSQPRSVIHEIWSKDESNKHIICFRHLAFKFSIHTFGEKWYVSILPTYSFTSDGIHKSRFSYSYMSGIKKLEDNQSVYYHFRFLAFYLSKINGDVNLLVESNLPYQIDIKEPVGFDFYPAIDDNKWNPPKTKATKEIEEQLKLNL